MQDVYLGVPWNPHLWKGGEKRVPGREQSCDADPNNTSANLAGALVVKQPFNAVLGWTGFNMPHQSVLHGAILETGVSWVRWLSAAGGHLPSVPPVAGLTSPL